jgi:phage tail tube protein FII
MITHKRKAFEKRTKHISFIRIRNLHSHDKEENNKVNTSLRSHRKNQTRGDKKQNEKRKTHNSMNKSANITPVQGLSTVVCMIVT